MVTESLDLLWLRLSCKSNTRLRCYNYGVPFMLNGFSIVIGLELELAWLLLFGSLWSLPSNLDQIFPKEKVGRLNQG